ncbi:MAG: cupredoxin domain-containing protein [Candidatus Micrarchaeota archaeon]
MERSMLMLIAVSIAGVLGLVMFAQMTAPAASAVEEVRLQPTFILGSGEPTANAGEVQIVEIRALGTGFYDKQEVRVKAGVPVRLRFSAELSSGCGRQLVMPDFGVNLISRSGETVEAEFTPQKGQYPYRCGMNMFRGVLYAN